MSTDWSITPTKKRSTTAHIKKATIKKIKSKSSSLSLNKPSKINVRCRGTRYFKLIDPETLVCGGRYTGSTPKQAASKGFTKLVQKYKNEGKTIPTDLTIFLQESTRGSSGKMFGYAVSREKLSRPITLNIGGATIHYEYRNKVYKIGKKSFPIKLQNKGKYCNSASNDDSNISSDDETIVTKKQSPIRKVGKKSLPNKKTKFSESTASDDESCDEKPKKVCVSSSDEEPCAKKPVIKRPVIKRPVIKRPKKVCTTDSEETSHSEETCDDSESERSSSEEVKMDDKSHVRPPSAYNTFIKETLPILKKNNPKMNQKDLMKIAAEEWVKKKNSPSFEDIVKRNPENFGKCVTGPSNIEFSDSDEEDTIPSERTCGSAIKIKYTKPYFMDAIYYNDLSVDGEWTIEQDEKMLRYLKQSIEVQSSKENMQSTEASIIDPITIDNGDNISCELLSPTDRSSCGIFTGRTLNDVALNIAIRLIKCGDYHNVTALNFAEIVFFCTNNSIEYVYHFNQLNNSTYTVKIFSTNNIFFITCD
jgi:hypothetical protein